VITIRDVARQARVSTATASRVVAQKGYASQAVRERVLEAARRLGYFPSRAARALRGVRRPAIGVVLPDLGIPVYVRWLRAAQERASRHGYVLLICDARLSAETARTQLRWLLEERVAGLLLAGEIGDSETIAAFDAAGIPVVPHSAVRPSRKPMREDAERPATLEAFRYAVGLGHRRIAYLAIGERDGMAAAPLRELRLECLRQALAEVRAPEDSLRLSIVDQADRCASEAARLIRTDAPTLFVAGTGELTAPILLALAQAELAIPDDVSMLAFGEGGWEMAYRPSIAVVRHDYAGIAAALTEYLIARIEGRAELPAVPSFPSEFLARGSLGPPPRSRRRVAAARAKRAR
jgi:LacI family transcriptional regulator